jgi:hypothetical protein
MSQVGTQSVGTIDEIKSLTNRLQQERAMHIEAAAALDKSLQSIRDEVTKLLGNDPNTSTPTVSPDTKNSPSPVQKRQSKPSVKTDKSNSVGNTRSRNGSISGTQKMVNILMKNSKKMDAKELRTEAVKQGVKNPHSALQSLTRSKTVKMSDGQVSLQV